MQHQLSVPFKNVPQGRLGLWILIAGELVIFGGLIVSYLLYRLRFPEWGEQAAYTSQFFGALNTVVLLFSSFAIVKAHAAATRKDIGKTSLWMTITILCGFVFLGNKTMEYIGEVGHGFTMTSPGLQQSGKDIGSLFWSFYYLMTGLHATHVLAGIVSMLVVLAGVRRGQNMHRVELVGMYWHMVDLIWIFLFPLLYIAN